MPGDARIEQDVVHQIRYDFEVDATNVTVSVEDGRVTLEGTVPSYSARQAATLDAWGVAGVTGVENLLAVDFPPAYPLPTDDEVERAARDALVWNPDLHGTDLEVAITGGVARLSGTVDAYWKKWKAERVVSGLRGVLDVENHLAVAPGESREDRRIAAEIEAALDRDRYVDAQRITVEVESGRVTLTGSVTTRHARDRVHDEAMSAPGVVDVDNRVAVMA